MSLRSCLSGHRAEGAARIVPSWLRPQMTRELVCGREEAGARFAERHDTGPGEGRVSMSASGSEPSCDVLIDNATLTGACVVALGKRFSSSLCDPHEKLVESICGRSQGSRRNNSGGSLCSMT